MTSVYEREFEFSRKDFEFIRDLVGERTGIVLSDHKVDLVYGRLSRRLRTLKIQKFSDYLDLLQSGNDEELVEFTNALTTNLTSFFRESHHFDFLRGTALPTIMRNRPNKRLRIWSAGCSTGEEPYTIAMTMKETVGLTGAWDTKVLATDLDSNVVATGRNATYSLEKVNGVSDARLKKWFRKGRGDDNSGKVQMAQELRDLISFKQLNLMNEWPMKGKMDVIFCRNVVIYFNKDTQRILFDRYADILADDGYLFVGHSETLAKVTDRFKLIGKTIYKKVG